MAIIKNLVTIKCWDEELALRVQQVLADFQTDQIDLEILRSDLGEAFDDSYARIDNSQFVASVVRCEDPRNIQLNVLKNSQGRAGYSTDISDSKFDLMLWELINELHVYTTEYLESVIITDLITEK